MTALTDRSAAARPTHMATPLPRTDRSEAHLFTLSRMNTFDNGAGPLPGQVTLLRPDVHDPSQDQLFLDQLLLPRDAWRYDSHDRRLSWRGAFGGGQLTLTTSRGGTGVIGPVDAPINVDASSTANFLCDMALNTGATYETSGGTVVGFNWDPTSPAWVNAGWVKGRLNLSYTVTTGGPFQPPTITFTFTDNQTEDVPWSPGLGTFASTLQLGNRHGLTVWDLTFKSNVPPQDDQGEPFTGPDSVYPYWMQVVEDAAASALDGVMMIDNLAPQGTLVGMRGVRQNARITGYYQAAEGQAPFGIFNGQLMVDGQPVPGTAVRGDTLFWNALPADLQGRLGLAAQGQATFEADGSLADAGQGQMLRRLSGNHALATLKAHEDLHPALTARHAEATDALYSSTLDIYGLLAMNPFVQNSQGQWGDAVQAAVTNDLSNIMNSFIPADMWKLLFPQQPQPSLTGELAVVANSPVEGVADPKAWYQSLATAVMTSGMSGGSDVNCNNMNGPRADQWLKSQVGTSKVYYTHSQLLFTYEWQQRFPLTAQYLTDQQTNAGTYSPQIDAQIAQSVNDINTNVVADATDPDLKTKLITEVTAVGAYAKTNSLYWAFAFYSYNTTPAVLANIALQMGINTGSSDGTTLSRLFQQNVAVLTALDPSGYFAQQYTTTINTFMATNILPSMFGFTGDAQSFDLIKQYLQYFVTQNLNNEDQQIAQAAAQISAILQDEDADKMLHDSLEALRDFSGAIQDALALPFIANRFVKWFTAKFPRFSSVSNLFGSLLIGGITGLAVFNLVTTFKQWDKLTDAQKAQVVIEASQIGLQIVAAVVKRGVRIYAIYSVEGMTRAQRAAAVSKIITVGEDSALDQGLVRIGNSAARWLADTEGTIGKLAVVDQGVVTAVLVNSAETAAEQAGWVGKVFGRNLDEFIATRVGPLFILAGIGFSIYQISQGEKGIQLASDIINIVSGSLMLFGTLGGWAVSGGLIAADGFMAGLISVAGPLAVLLALAGVGLMIYELTQTPPDPVEEFVKKYVQPAGFYVAGKASSVDYVTQYINPDQKNLLMIGCTLGAGTSVLSVSPQGTIGVGAATALPDCVWQVTTDAQGLSQIITLIQPDPKSAPVAGFLSLLDDQTVAFRPQMAKAANPPQGLLADEPKVTSQTWLSRPSGTATLTSDGKNLASLNLTWQAVLPDAKGNYAPAQAAGFLVQTASGVTYQAGSGSTFTLRMSGMAPNYMKMVDVNFILNSTPSVQQSFGPAYGVYPSTPATFALSPQAPSFLTFGTTTGALVPTGQPATPASSGTYTVTAQNALGTAQTTFTLSVTAPTPPA
ncbi:Ig domain-containing protein [Deinococcus sp. HMF7604]|uniref:Ig domain-containing protein n=1 Tax=Deinococcus betulae TaxID=2873312 RepID=UPI001CCAEEDA|nr:Ig domain-containing protein [Deinococcus betulae]MBZ9751539.1 Ig domain-containing protein [Deinococcus betulae]